MSQSDGGDDFVMLSALQHYLFCPRQCALIHIEGVWSENYLTASGRTLHERVDKRGGETRRDVHLATALRLVSRSLGLMGVADMVEFHRMPTPFDAGGARRAAKLSGLTDYWRPFPVEYKRGEPKAHRADEVQLCAQALCLEEMLSVAIREGALFYGETRRRTEVEFNDELRALTKRTAGAVRQLIASGVTPSPQVSKGCRACSLEEICQPERMDGKSAKRWLERQVAEAAGTQGESA